MGKMNKDDANKMAQAVDNRIVQIAKQVYRQVPNDREVEGFVTAFESKYNSYTVKINNKEYSAIPQERTLGSIEIGTTVKVKIPNNQMSNAYICGIVDGSIKSNPYPLPLGMIIPSAIVQNDAGLHLLDGGELAIGGTYDAFCQFIISNSSRVATCTTAEYQAEINTYGQCGKFVITNTYVKLPTITKFIEGLSDISSLGTSFSAGLPNITGSLTKSGTSQPISNGSADGGGNNDFVSSGAIYGTNTYVSNYFSTASGASSRITGIHIDASRYNSIYGNSTTVQPQSTKFPYYIVVGTIINKDIAVNINNITADLQNKADKDLGNVTYPLISVGSITTGSGDRVIEQYVSSDGKTWYRKWASGWKEQGGFYDNGSETNDKAGIVVTFPLAFSDTIKYTVVSQAFKVNGTTDAANRTPVATIYNQTSTGFYGGWYGYTGRYFKWYACGY